MSTETDVVNPQKMAATYHFKSSDIDIYWDIPNEHRPGLCSLFHT